MNTPKTFAIKPQEENPQFPFGIILATTIPSYDDSTEGNSFSIKIFIKEHPNEEKEAKLTLLNGTDHWENTQHSIRYYRANVKVDETTIPCMVYHYRDRLKEEYYLTLLKF